jgi:hypothetical protein
MAVVNPLILFSIRKCSKKHYTDACTFKNRSTYIRLGQNCNYQKKKQSKPDGDGYPKQKKSNFSFWVTLCVLPSIPQNYNGTKQKHDFSGVFWQRSKNNGFS